MVAQSEDPEDHIAPAAYRVRAGTLLLANTDLLEPTFRRSVIYIVEHNDGGTLGVVLNRPSDADVAEIEYTAFKGSPEEITGRLIVRRVRDLNHKTARGQDELFPAWRYHPVFTDSPFETLQAERHHREHAIVE